MNILSAISDALWLSFKMFWQIFWGLSLGFAFSVMTEVLVSKSEMKRLLPDASWWSIFTVGAFGAASPSCSYAAVIMPCSMVRKGADFILQTDRKLHAMKKRGGDVLKVLLFILPNTN